MRLISLLTGILVLGAAATAADAQYYYQRVGPYFMAGNTIEPVRREVVRVPAHDVFFTPVPAYSRPGYTCLPLSEVTTVGGREVVRPGTLCKANGI